MPKWLYGIIRTTRDGDVQIVVPHTHQIHAPRPVLPDPGLGDKGPEDVLLRAVAMVGDEGWELISADNGVLYFRIPLSD